MKISNRDLNIAKASLAVYPAGEAFLESRSESNWLIHDHYHTIHIQASGGRTTEKIAGWYRCADKEFGYDFNYYFDCDASRRFPDNSTKEVWMNNFSLVALELHAAKLYAKRAIHLKKLLTEKMLCTRPCWAVAVSKVIAQERPKEMENVYRIGPTGVVRGKPRLDFQHHHSGKERYSYALIDAIIKLAKDFVPTTKPTPANNNHNIGFCHISWFADQEDSGLFICLSDKEMQDIEIASVFEHL